jgi:DNA polymerase II large subunit
MKRNEIKINSDDIQVIFGGDIEHFNKILDTVYCTKCGGSYDKTIVNYTAYLTKLNDIVLKGECKTCSGKVARYIETGESEERFAAADHIRNIKKNYKEI